MKTKLIIFGKGALVTTAQLYLNTMEKTLKLQVVLNTCTCIWTSHFLKMVAQFNITDLFDKATWDMQCDRKNVENIFYISIANQTCLIKL